MRKTKGENHRRPSMMVSIVAVILLLACISNVNFVEGKSCYAQLNANDIFFSRLDFSSGKSSTVLQDFYVTSEKLSDIHFTQDTDSGSPQQQVKSHLILCPVPRGTDIVCNKSMVDLQSQSILSDKYGFQYDAIYTTIRVNPSDPYDIQIGKYTHQTKDGGANSKQFQSMGSEVTNGLLMMKPQLQFEPTVGSIYLFNISKPLYINNIPQNANSHTVVKMMIVSLVGSTITIRWDVLYSSTGNQIQCFIEGDASFKLEMSDGSLSVPTVLGTHVIVFVSVVALAICVLSMFAYQIFRCKCFSKRRYYVEH